jgi:short-subunit dehydrogenase
MTHGFFILIYIFVIIQLVGLVKCIYDIVKKYLFTCEINLAEKYGSNTWVLITGCSSGQGEHFAYEFAKRNFNIILLGNKGIKLVEKKIKELYGVKTLAHVTNFCNSYKKKYFKKIEKILDNLDGELSILVNNVGHRTGWYPYHNMPEQKINDTIVCGTIVQARLTQIAIKHFERRKSEQTNHYNKITYKSAIINITAMCSKQSFWVGGKNHFSIPYLSVYEASNAFGFYHSNSIQKEYEKTIDILNITPGAVITKNAHYLEDVIFSIKCEDYVKNVFKLIGNYTGPQHAHWKHELSGIMANFLPGSISDKILLGVGKLIADNFMSKYNYQLI